MQPARTFPPLPSLTASVRPALARAFGPERLWDSLALIVLATVALVAVLTFTDYGVTWDEDVHNWYGNLVLDYYLSFFTDQRSLHWQNLYNYGALFDTIAAALNRFSPLGTYETRHLLDAGFGVFGLVGCWKLGRLMGGKRAGLFALLFLLLTPNYYGQMFNNPKDIPFAVGGVWATYYMVRILPDLPHPSWRLLVKLGLAIGLALGVRVGGLLFLCYLGLLLCLSGLWQAMAARRPLLLARVGWTSLWRVLLPIAAIGFAVMLLFWPWAQHDPLHHPLQALAFFSHETFPFYTLFDGSWFPASNLPWTYLPTYILLALPELVLVLLAAAALLAVIALVRPAGHSHPSPPRTRGSRASDGAVAPGAGCCEPSDRTRSTTILAGFLLAFTIVFPVAYAIAIKAVLFDGMRHFLFVLPPIAVAAALAMERALAALSAFPYRRPVYAGLALYAVAHVATMAMLHPDQYVYYNGFVGGVDGAQRKFKLDYWANSYAEAVRGLEAYLQAQYGADFDDREFTVAVCGPPVSAAYYFPSNFRYMYRRDQADFFIAFTKDNCDKALTGRPVYSVARMGALLSVVLDRRDILAEQRLAKRPLAGALPRHLPVSAYP